MSKFTYHAGLEVRPVDALLFRATYGTAFRGSVFLQLTKKMGGSAL